MPKRKVQKDKQRSTKHTYKTKDGVTRTPLKTVNDETIYRNIFTENRYIISRHYIIHMYIANFVHFRLLMIKLFTEIYLRKIGIQIARRKVLISTFCILLCNNIAI
jgi:hypothetical protein